MPECKTVTDRSRCILAGGGHVRSRKTTAGRETTTSGLTETTNTAL